VGWLEELLRYTLADNECGLFKPWERGKTMVAAIQQMVRNAIWALLWEHVERLRLSYEIHDLLSRSMAYWQMQNWLHIARGEETKKRQAHVQSTKRMLWVHFPSGCCNFWRIDFTKTKLDVFDAKKFLGSHVFQTLGNQYC
jgi:hypothetical protein